MIIFWFILVFYLAIVLLFVFGFYRVAHNDHISTSPTIAFSIIVPFRNEAENLPNLLNSFTKINYPKDLFEILLVNDHSEDDSRQIVEKYSANTDLNITLLENTTNLKSPKKTAIKMAIKYSKHPWILTTDADCIVPRTWLLSYCNFIETHNSKMVVGPVTYKVSNAFFDVFQLLDFLSLQSITIGAFGLNKPFLCNGANFAYSKEFFTELNGFSGNDHLTSGDDIFLLENAYRHSPKTVHYLMSRNAIVATKPQKNIDELINQRVRWAKKSSSYKSPFVKLVGVIVFAMNLGILVALAFFLLGQIGLKDLIILFGLKILVDLLCIVNSLRFFDQINHLGSYLLSSLLHPFFTVYIGIKSMFSGYNWKERTYAN